MGYEGGEGVEGKILIGDEDDPNLYRIVSLGRIDDE